MSELPWFKFYTEAFGDPKFDVVANDNRMQPWEVLGIWTSLLCIAANSPVRGTLAISELRGLGIKDLKSIIKWNDNYWDNTEFQDMYNFEGLIQSFMELDMITLDNYGTYKIKNFEERQETKEEKTARLNRERQKRYQDNHKDDESVINNVINNTNITQDSSSISSSYSSSISNSLSDSLINNNNIEIIRKLYAENIGTITPLMEKTLLRADQEYPAEWFAKAFEIAVGSGHKRWDYIEGILKNWQANGYHPGKPKDDRVSVEGRSRYGEWEVTK